MSLDSLIEYGLSFSEDAVHLQHREAASDQGKGQRRPAWRHLGSVDFDEPTFREDLIQLRMMATGGDADLPLTVTLVIPDDQILYTTLTIEPSGDRERAVGRALDGLTPYAIEELAFDWVGSGDSVRVAAVARQTLREARDFAAEYGFDGSGFCADPDAAQFPGEPGFVLEQPQRMRPTIDPALAGVTAAAIMIADETTSATEAATDPSGSVVNVPAFAKGKGVESDSATEETDHQQGEPSAHEDLGAKAAEFDLPADATGASAQDAQAEVPDLTARSSSSEKPADAKPIPSIIRHGPASSETRKPGINPRAEAVMRRAAEARQSRNSGEAAQPKAPTAPRRQAPGHRGGLGRLAVMLAGLILGLVLIGAYILRDEVPAQISAPPEEPEITGAAEPSDPPVGDTASVSGRAQDEGRQAPNAFVASEIEAEPIEPGPAGIAVAAGPAGEGSREPSPAAPAPEPVVAVEAETGLGELELPPLGFGDRPLPEQRAILRAAAAVAAAVVPPARVTATPEPVAPSPATAAANAAPAAAPAAAAAEPSAPSSSPAEPSVIVTRATRPVSAPDQRTSRPSAETAVPPRAEAAVARVTSSVRPQLSPRRSTPQATEPRMDTAPRVPSDPLPYTESQRASQPITSTRPPARSRAAAEPEAQTQTLPAADRNASVIERATPFAGGIVRPPQRPEGSAPEPIGPDVLNADEQAMLRALIEDIGRRTALASKPVPRAFGPRFADTRPVRKPAQAGAATDVVSPSAINEVLKSANANTPDKPSAKAASVASSSRPAARPSGRGSASTVSDQAVEKAIASAVNASTATPGGVQLSALRSSPLPPRRSDSGRPPKSDDKNTAEKPDQSATDGAVAAAVAATAGPSEAEIAARRALDEQLQAQAEARIRARAQADAAAEAQARAQAEARARAQAEAEERAARARKQDYKPPEVDDEPEVAANAASGGVTAASVAKAATESRALDTGRTTIIGIIGAGNASRALIRLRNGKIVTVRLGDKIDGGTINSIGNGRLTYVKAGKTRELRLLDGR
ncbi:hypothetical protein RGQ15_08175 [Paracoccus sp. MBLB3053]|uniref:Translation initiation factor 2 n=1 Tax=Paracoccus aurantius TaxID=3073814 RepID=A0ABU2HSK7_9RHOB|nr:hypothetical protein [Paracoccus sp. MBLB3053]MDS9467550.1 hypothetical protein [Paracoccus sp. MBLB3053]